MYAVVDIAGVQYKVAPKEKVVVPSLHARAGEKVTFDRVLLLGGEKQITVGHPLVPGALVEATVVEHFRGDKLTVFKKKKRKGYRVRRGHRQGLTRIEILSIAGQGAGHGA